MQKNREIRTLIGSMISVAAAALMATAAISLAEEKHNSKSKPTPTPIVKDMPGSGGRSTGPTHPTPPPTTQHAEDLRTKMAHLKLKDGDNVILSEGGVKLIAIAQGGRVTGWKATNGKGEIVPTKITRDEAKGKVPGCSVCWTTDRGVLKCRDVTCPTVWPVPK